MNSELEEYIKLIIEEFKPLLFLDRHSINVEYKDSNEYLSCKFSYPYLDTIICYNDRCVNNFLKHKEDLKPQIVHELCHLITDPLYSKATDRYVGKNEIEDERENLTDLISKIVLNKK